MLKTAALIPAEYNIIINKATERPGSGKFDSYPSTTQGTYLCRQCGLALFRSDNKFVSGCGWPSFDSEIDSNVKKVLDADNIRTEILCNRCDGHLGHIFHGEQLTVKNTRYCVNSLSLDFISNNNSIHDSEEIIFAAGCFWGVEYLLMQQPGVLYTQVGYIGDEQPNPNYQTVCSGKTQHVEAVRVIYDPLVITCVDLIKVFFEIHDFTQTDGQGPDIGNQYLSKIFYYTPEQKNDIYEIIKYLQAKNFQVATVIQNVSPFWPAEDYHQDYYKKTAKQPYCHSRTRIFV